MNLQLARIISFVFNPLFALIFLPYFLVYKTTNNVDQAIFWTIYSLFFIVGVGGFIFGGIRKKTFSDWDVSTRAQRPILFTFLIIVGLLYLTGLYIFKAPYILFVVIAGMILGVMLVSVINKKIKASIHVATISALALGIALGYGGYFILFLLLIPLLSWARIRANRHTLQETIAGAAIGSFLILMIYGYFKFFMKG